jgi:hypothetical protein
MAGPSTSYVGTPYSKGGGDVRGTPAPAASTLPAGSAPDAFPSDAPDTPAPIHLSVQPSGTSGTSVRSHWHMLCDQARDHCRYLRTHATG